MRKPAKVALVLPPGAGELRGLLEALVTGEGMTLAAAYTCADRARRGLGTCAPDAILIASGVPGGSLAEIVRACRREPGLAGSALILVPWGEGADAEDIARALASGALLVVDPPAKIGFGALSRWQREVAAGLKRAAATNRRAGRPAEGPRGGDGGPAAPPGGPTRPPLLLAIGISTGGPQALAEVLPELEPGLPPLLIVQHIPERFAYTLADRLARYSGHPVKVAEDGEAARPGGIYLAPGSAAHLLAGFGPGGIRLRLDAGPKVGGHRPSADALFLSIAAGKIPSAAVLMTGMGADGARGLLELCRQGSATAAQDQATSVVYGMPMAARRNGAAGEILPLGGIAAWLNRLGRSAGRRAG